MSGHDLAYALGFTALVAAPRASAQVPAPSVALRWDASDPRCIDSVKLGKSVEATLSRHCFSDERDSDGRIEGSIMASPSGGYRADIRLIGRDGVLRNERTLETSGECARLDESVAVVVALMIDGFAGGAEPLRLAPDAPRQPRVDLRRSPTELVGASVAAGPQITSGMLPGIAVGGMARGEVDPAPWLGLTLSFRIYAPTQARVREVGGSFSAWHSDFGLCPMRRIGSVQLSGCLGVGAGVASADPVGLANSRGISRPLLLAELAGRVYVPIGNFARLGAELGMLAPMRRDPWGFYDTAGRFIELHRVPAVLPSAALMLQFNFW